MSFYNQYVLMKLLETVRYPDILTYHAALATVMIAATIARKIKQDIS